MVWQTRQSTPSYSGAIMTSTFAMVRELGWEYFEKLAKQKVMQVQSAVDPPKKVAHGERAGNGRWIGLHRTSRKGQGSTD